MLIFKIHARVRASARALSSEVFMRSYYEHLETAMGSPKAPVPPKPVTRSSAIFPALQLPGIHSRILFMGYWLLKRNIQEILAVVNLRSESGQLLGRTTFPITQAKTYRIELSDQLVSAGFPADATFVGSLEVEFFSTVNLVFPYPAVVINYYGPNFSTVVHTAQRVYNDFDDLRRNSQTQVPESGFNIYADEDKEPFIGLINGAEAVEAATLDLEVFNSAHETLRHSIDLGALQPYETRILYPAREVDLQTFLKGGVGAGKARFKVNWIFPRLLVGNLHRNLQALTVTHTYYDTSTASSQSDYWRPTETGWNPASLMVPCSLIPPHYTNVYFYPIYSPSEFSLDVEFYSAEGKMLGRAEHALTIKSPADEFHKLELKKIAHEMGISARENLGARIVARTTGEQKLPARVKLGLDIGTLPLETPCNICTNLQPFNPDLEGKPRTFRWAPVLTDQSAPVLWIMNSSPQIEYQRTAEIEMTFHREQDTQTIMRHFSLPPHGFRVLYPNEDPELIPFFGGQVGWFTMTSTTPHISTYYFAENSSGMVGGDHGF